MVRSLETKYKGYRFRSRLEARWAVFFDSLRLPWEYEKEGFDLGGTDGYYLPDFWLPTVSLRGYSPDGVWVEIKGERIENDDKKTIAFAHSNNDDDPGRNAVLFHGLPLEDEEAFQCGPWWDNCMLICKCYNPNCGHIKIEFSESNYMQCDRCGHRRSDNEHPDLLKAADTARAARFEHGKRP